MEIVLCAVEKPLADAWAKFCGDCDGVSVHHGSILDLDVDAVVSPANSFGFMDGGIDALYTRHFGRIVQDRLQARIVERHHGELLVGAAEIVPTDDDAIPYVIAAPTMRVPTVLTDTVNPYLAARAALLLVRHGRFDDGTPIADTVRRIAFPGLGTGVGRVGAATCARQVAAAIRAVVFDAATFPATWVEASYEHQSLYTDRIRNLQLG